MKLCIFLTLSIFLAAVFPQLLFAESSNVSINALVPGCGDGIIENSEQCDGSNLGGQTCNSFNSSFSGGILSCTSSCSFDVSQCTSLQANSSPSRGFFMIPPPKVKEVNTHNQDLILDPDQSGVYIKDTAQGAIMLQVPSQSTVATSIFIISEEPLKPENESLVLDGFDLVNGVFYNVFVIDQNRNFIHQFSKKLTINLPLEEGLQTENIGVYWLDEDQDQWVVIPNIIFLNNNVQFQVDHLTMFAIFKPKEKISVNQGSEAPVLQLPPGTAAPIVENQKSALLDVELSIARKPGRSGLLQWLVILGLSMSLLYIFWRFLRYKMLYNRI